MLSKIKNVFIKVLSFLFGDKKTPFKQRLISCLIVNFGFVFSVFIFIPFETYIGNSDEFTFAFTDFALSVLLLGICLFVVMTFAELLFKGKLFRLLLSAVFGVTLASYVQSMFLNGMMKSLDGAQDTYSESQVIINLIIWLVVFLAPVVICFFWEKLSGNVNKFLSLAITAVQLVGLVSVVFTVSSPQVQTLPTCEGLYDVSGKKNVVVFVLDRYDSKNIENILAEDPTYLDMLNGFTYYPNTVGSYVYTQNTLPYLMTGIEDPDLYITADEKAQNIENSQYLKTIDEFTDSLCIYSEPKFLETTAENITELVDNVNEVELKLDTLKLVKPTIKSALYRVAPFMFKSRFSYLSGDFNAAAYSDKDNTVYRCEDHKYDAQFLSTLNAQGLAVNEAYGETAFRIIHFQGAHFPYHITAEGKYSETETDLITASKGSLQVVYKYLDELKRLGLYEDASIFITSDHGETILISDLATFDAPNTNPIMFYKPSGVGENEPFKTSNAPACHTNIFPTVIKELGADYTSFGTPITDLNEGDQITREFYWSVQDPTRTDPHYLPHKYIVEGDARDKASWKYVSGPVE